ncbi:MAG: hypothetical protein AB1430_03285 [Pseudomonadota bacterium]
MLAEDMRLNGMPVRLYQFRADWSVPQLRERLGEMLGPRMRADQVGRQWVVSAPVGASIVTLRIRPSAAGGSEGELMQTGLDRAAARAAPPPRMPADSLLISQSEAQDEGRSGSVVLLQNRQSTAANDEFFSRQFESQGLRKVASRQSKEGARAIQASHYAGERQDASVVIQDLGEVRLVTVHQMREWK